MEDQKTPVTTTNTTPQTLAPPPSVEAPHMDAPQSTNQQEQDNKSKHNIRGLISTVALFLAAPLLAVILIVFVIQSYEVDGQSMQDTLHDHDLLIVNKLPRTMSRITHKDYLPPRGQIVIFSRDEGGLGGSSSKRQLVKRVVGLPGERVTVQNGEVTVYNAENPKGFNPDKLNEYTKDISGTPGNVDLIVQPGQIFVMGDNRGNSLDSRYFGPINASDLVGNLGIRIFPLNKAQRF